MNKIRDYLKKQKISYYKIKSIRCKIFDNESVIFNKHVLRHLIRKYGHNRTITEQVRRLNLLKYCYDILESDNVSIENRFSKTNKLKVEFWGITKKINGRYIRIVLRRIGKGKLIFLSIMDF